MQSLLLDTNECDIEPCDDKAACSNTVGSFVCDCQEGFEGNGIFCDDINECLRPEYNYGDCDANCSNTFGSYDCFCPHGFLEDPETGKCDGGLQFLLCELFAEKNLLIFTRISKTIFRPWFDIPGWFPSKKLCLFFHNPPYVITWSKAFPACFDGENGSSKFY